jgi:RNA polymerase sigma-70 factor (ECF subfamily)
VNTCLMKLRARSRQGTVSIDGLLPTFDEQGRHARPVGRWSDGAPCGAGVDDVRAHVRECIEQLPDDYRTVLILRDIEEFDTEQTAGILGMTTTNVKVRLHRARLALRTLLSPLVVAESA